MIIEQSGAGYYNRPAAGYRFFHLGDLRRPARFGHAGDLQDLARLGSLGGLTGPARL